MYVLVAIGVRLQVKFPPFLAHDEGMLQNSRRAVLATWRDARACETHMPAEACPFVHAAFYLWYGTPAIDGKWLHWDHRTMPHWTAKMNEQAWLDHLV